MQRHRLCRRSFEFVADLVQPDCDVVRPREPRHVVRPVLICNRVRLLGVKTAAFYEDLCDALVHLAVSFSRDFARACLRVLVAGGPGTPHGCSRRFCNHDIPQPAHFVLQSPRAAKLVKVRQLLVFGYSLPQLDGQILHLCGDGHARRQLQSGNRLKRCLDLIHIT